MPVGKRSSTSTYLEGPVVLIAERANILVGLLRRLLDLIE